MEDLALLMFVSDKDRSPLRNHHKKGVVVYGKHMISKPYNSPLQYLLSVL